MPKKIILAFFLLFSFIMMGQSGFTFESGKNKSVIPFKLINNLIFIPIKVNGVELNFLLDSGVEETMLFSLEDTDGGVNFKNAVKIRLRGLGSAESIEGLKSSNNVLQIGELKDINHDVYIILDQNFNFSSHIGIPVNGIIGYHFFKNKLVEINYDKERITVYEDYKQISKKVSKKFTEIPISIELSKPYVTSGITINDKTFPAKLLVDTGSADPVWLFQGKSADISIPEKNFEDFLGFGFSGAIYGKRGRISKFDIGGFEFKQPVIAFPDSSSIKNIKMVSNRVGSLGGEILKRFAIIFDYREKKLYLNKSGNFSLPFHYNMSGMEIQHGGLQWVQETVAMQTSQNSESYYVDGSKVRDFKYKFVLKPFYTISTIRKDSPAELAGLKKDDVLLSINKSPAHSFDLNEINAILKSTEGRIIEVEIERDSQVMRFRFELKNTL